MQIIQPFATLNDHSPIADIISMIERKAPLMMRSHLGHLPREQERVTASKKLEIRREVAATAQLLLTEAERRKKFEAIAQKNGVHYSTVIKHTVDIRNAPATDAKEERT